MVLEGKSIMAPHVYSYFVCEYRPIMRITLPETDIHKRSLKSTEEKIVVEGVDIFTFKREVPPCNKLFTENERE